MNEQELMAERAATYGLLARLFIREADVELLEALDALPLEEGQTARSMGRGMQHMKAFLKENGTDSLTPLSVDFARLFLVRSAHTTDAPYPFESVYTSHEHRVMGTARDEVVASYREEGLNKSSQWNLPEDHLALELEFEQLLCQRTAEALESGDKEEGARLLAKQHDFLVHHLLTWTPEFFAAMKRTAQTSFYQGLALFAAGFLEEDERLLSDLLG